MKTHTHIKYTSSTLLLATLVACGGGGGSESSSPTKPVDPIVSTCANGAKDYPTCTPPYVAADLQTTVVRPPFPDGSEVVLGFDFLNDTRAKLGLGKLNYNALLAKAADNHWQYILTNKEFGHTETLGKPGFTGVRPTDRAAAVGYSASYVGEVIATGEGQIDAYKTLINSIYHRSGLFDQGYRDVGTANSNIAVSQNMSVGAKTPQRNASDFVLVYPMDGQTDIQHGMCAEEPWPFPEVNRDTACTNSRYDATIKKFYRDYLVGYPILMAIQKDKVLTIKRFQLFEAGSNTPLETWLHTKTDPTTLVGSYEAYITKKGGLKIKTKYEVVFEGAADGVPFSKTWSFTTY